MVVGSASAVSTSASDGSIQVTGQGTFKIIIKTATIEVQEDGVSLTTTQDGDYWTIEGEVNGEPNSSPNDYVYVTFDGYENYYNKTSDDGVDLDVNVY